MPEYPSILKAMWFGYDEGKGEGFLGKGKGKGKLLKETIRTESANEAVSEAANERGHYEQMDEMMKALANRELGDNKKFIEDLVELNSRMFGKHHKLTTENLRKISEDISKLCRRYSAIHKVKGRWK